ncbi:hypothetical protein EPO05_01685 [Patescibacteria group bacterium]|nr:MAG: hypothetical protein EPO05_01685 [Patescibacteria group bacterium]
MFVSQYLEQKKVSLSEENQHKPALKRKGLVFLISFLLLLLIPFAKAKAVAPLVAIILGAVVIGTIVFSQGSVNPLLAPINIALYAVLAVMVLLINIAGAILDVAVNSQAYSQLLAHESVVSMWGFIRDFLNMLFIFALLFSAFCTIYQVSKYHLKNVVLWVVLMALLVNFSYPITRFVIDAANIPMFYFLNEGLTPNKNGQISPYFSPMTNIGLLTEKALSPGIASSMSSDTTLNLIFAIIFLFIFMVTLMGFAITLLVRMLILVILLILSPAGFTLYAFPSTKHYAGQWWDKLMKTAFQGPVLAFFLYLAISMFTMQSADLDEFKEGIKASGGNVEQLVILGVYFSVPIALLWIGLSMSSTMGAAGSGMAMSWAKSAGNKVRGLGKVAWTGTGVPGAASKSWEGFKKSGKLFGKLPIMEGSAARGDRESRWAARITGGRGAAAAEREAALNRRARERADEHKKFGTDTASLHQALGSNDAVERRAALMASMDGNKWQNAAHLQAALAAAKKSDGRTTDTELQKQVIDKLKADEMHNLVTNYDELRDVMAAAGNPDVKSAMTAKMRDQNAKTLIEYEANNGVRSAEESVREHLGKMKAGKLADQRGMHETGFLEGNTAVGNAVGAHLHGKNAEYKQKMLEEGQDSAIRAWRSAGIVD